MSAAELYSTYLLSNYAPPAITLARGVGSRVWDEAGKSYLDFCGGIAVNSLGHSHPKWVAAVCKQAGILAHTSNLFRHEGQGKLAERLVRYAGGSGKMFFCNSGTEANEALLKLARLHGCRKSGGKEGVAHEVIVAGNAFHGRTFGAMAATPQEKIQHGFRPMLPGICVAELNNLASFEALMSDKTAAVLLEPVQGESGLTVATPEFLRGLRALCDRHNALLMFDEIQCGMGRTGKMFGFQNAGVSPDAFSLAKGIAGGFPMGAIWAASGNSDLFTPGSHGSTFAGNPLACAAALAVLDVYEEENLLEKVTARTPGWHAALREAAGKSNGVITGVRGVGYMSGLALNEAPAPFVAKLREAGLLSVPAGNNVIRLLPPLNATPEELAESAEIVGRVFADKA